MTKNKCKIQKIYVFPTAKHLPFNSYMGKGGRSKTQMRYVCRPKKTYRISYIKKLYRRSALRADLRYNFSLFSLIHLTRLRHVFYILSSCGDMGVGQPTPCQRMF